MPGQHPCGDNGLPLAYRPLCCHCHKRGWNLQIRFAHCPIHKSGLSYKSCMLSENIMLPFMVYPLRISRYDVTRWSRLSSYSDEVSAPEFPQEWTISSDLLQMYQWLISGGVTFSLVIPLPSCMISCVPRVLRRIADLRGSSNRTVAAPWKTIETSLCRRAASSGDKARPLHEQSPGIATTFLNRSGYSFRTKSYNWKT